MQADLMLSMYVGCVCVAFSCKCLASMRVAGNYSNEKSYICRRKFGPQSSRGTTLIYRQQSRVDDDGGQNLKAHTVCVGGVWLGSPYLVVRRWSREDSEVADQMLNWCYASASERRIRVSCLLL